MYRRGRCSRPGPSTPNRACGRNLPASAAAQQQATDLAGLTSLFDLTGNSGISASLTDFARSVSRLSVNPNDPGSRQSMIDAAKDVAASFRQTAGGIQSSAGAGGQERP